MALGTAPSGVRIVNVLEAMPDIQTGHRQFSLRNAQIVHEPDGRLFNLTFGPHARENYFSPRHRHTFDQVRLIVSGRAKYGALRMDAHDVAYFPEGVFYGPAEALSEQVTTCVIQTQGASWSRFMTRVEQADAARRAALAGCFDTARGLYRRADGRLQDSYEALLETTLGHPVEYPAARYHYPVLLRSANFAWRSVADQPGVSWKPLVTFAGGPGLSWLEISPGATLELPPLESHRLLVIVSGSVAIDINHAPGTFVHVAPGAQLSTRAAERSLLLSCEFETRLK
jgi:hypothetical protein